MKLVARGLLLWIVFLLVTPTAEAARLYLDPSQTTTGRGGTVVAKVRLDTNAEQCINAVSGSLHFDEGLYVEDVSVGQSIFNLWLPGYPSFDNDTNSVEFSAGIPNGYCGPVPGDPSLTNTIFEIVLRTESQEADGQYEATRVVDFASDATGYLNDGKGTMIALGTQGTIITVTDEYVGGENDEWLQRVAEDTTPPKEFSITLASKNDVYNGKYFISFNTNDKQTGIDHYEVYEEPFDQIEFFGWGAVTAPWQEVVSPYELKDQSLNSTIRVKAVDKNGNEYIAVLVPDEELRGVNVNLIVLYGIGLLFFTVLVIVLWSIWHLYHSRRAERLYEAVADDIEGDNAQDNSFTSSNHFNHDR